MKVMSDPDAATHWKFYDLARILDVHLAQAFGHFEILKGQVMMKAPDGVMVGWNSESIARAAKWDGDAEAFVNALKHVRLLDPIGEHLAIHQWVLHQGDVVAKRAEWARRSREAYERRHGKSKEKPATGSGKPTNGDQSAQARQEEILVARLKDAHAIGGEATLLNHARGWISRFGFERAEEVLAKVPDGLSIHQIQDDYFKKAKR